MPFQIGGNLDSFFPSRVFSPVLVKFHFWIHLSYTLLLCLSSCILCKWLFCSW